MFTGLTSKKRLTSPSSVQKGKEKLSDRVSLHLFGFEKRLALKKEVSTAILESRVVGSF